MTIHPVPKPKSEPKARRRLRPRQPLKRTTLKNGAGSKRRGGHMFPKNVDEHFRRWIRRWPCIIGGMYRAALFCDPQGRFYEHRCLGRVQACHVKSRGSGAPDHNNLVPLCAGAHEEQHRRGTAAFQKRYRCDLASAAASYWNRYLRENAAGPGVERGGAP